MVDFLKDDILNNSEPMMSWSRRSGNNFILKKKIRKLLNLLSGNKMVEMMKDVLNRSEKIKILEKYKRFVIESAKLCNNAKQKNRHKYVRSLRNAGISYREAVNDGYKISTHLWKTCLNENDRSKGGRPRISQDLKYEINRYIESNSSIASNRYLKKMETNAFYMNTSITESYQSFINKNKLHFSTYYKYIEDKYKHPHRLTDLCEYCEYHKDLKIKITSSINEIEEEDNYVDPNFILPNIDPDKLINHYQQYSKNDERIKILIQNLIDFKNLEFHRSIAMRQRNSYNYMRSDKEYLKNNLLIEIDFKQKIVIGLGPRDLNSSYYNRVQRSYVSFGIYYTNEKEEVECLNMDVVLNDTKQTAFTAIRAFRFIRDADEFKRLDKLKYTIWTDCGPHFRCGEFSYFVFNELASKGISVSLNFFAEKHGKSSRDQHFSSISYFIKAGSYEKRLTCTQDLVEAIKRHQEIANKRRIDLKLKQILLWIAEMPVNYSQINQKKYRKIANIRSLYNLQTNLNIELNSRELNVDFIDSGDDSEIESEKSDDEASNRKVVANIATQSIENAFKLTTTIFSDLKNHIEVKSIFQISTSTSKDKTDFIDELAENKVILNKIQKGIKKKSQKIMTMISSDKASFAPTAKNVGVTPYLILPQYCALMFQKNKTSCSNCNALKLYEYEDIEGLTQEQINEELHKHGHLKGMIIGKGKKTHQRLVGEGRVELMQHYSFAHCSI